jgi:hypothetical protein
MKTKIILSVIAVALTAYSCEWLGADKKDTGSVDIVQGLKTALNVGTDSAVKFTHAQDGFYKDALIKILLPPEADVIVNNIGLVPGGAQMVEDVVVRINRAAESAANDAGPIFAKSITDLSISQGMDILNGTNPADSSKSALAGQFDSLAATHYLKSTTFSPLKATFQPYMTTALNTDMIASISANDAWGTLTNAYNSVANTLAGQLAGLKPVTISLDDYVTTRGLDGLFLKVGDQERLIRRDPFHWAATAVGDILTAVFGKSNK